MFRINPVTIHPFDRKVVDVECDRVAGDVAVGVRDVVIERDCREIAKVRIRHPELGLALLGKRQQID